jgi:PAS domain S-box-containing protein
MNVSALQGSRSGVVVSHENITERKVMENELIASEAKFRSIIEVSPIPMAMNDEQLNITFLNSAFVQAFGYTIEDIPSLPDWWPKAYPDPDYRHWVQSTWQETLEKAKQEQTDFPPMEVSIRCKDNNIKIVLATAVTIQHDFAGMNLAILYDITRRKQVENELTRSNAELEQFAYAVSHDMRQPLRMVTSYLSLIESALGGQLDEETQQFLKFAVDGAKRMDAMILSLLDYSRVGRKTEAKTRISSRISLDEALAFLGPEINACGCEIKVSGDWPELFASRDELTRLLQNLIGNALKYHEENQPPQVHVHGEVCAGSLRVEVRDQGIGIEPKQMDRLFKVFSRLQARSRFDGTGVGLALCRKIVEHHHGTIGVESAGEGQGCMFWFELPIVDVINTE